MLSRRPSLVRIALAVLALSSSAGIVRAEGFLEFLFGEFNVQRQQATPVRPFESRRPTALTVRPRYSARVRGTVFCVRTCDGRYFPLQRSVVVQSAQICNSLCPASRTKVFSGADISRAVAADGSRYLALDNAFRYRQQTVADCTCNGVTSYGLAAIDMRDDPTLRPGDLIAIEGGLMKSLDMMTAPQKTAARRVDDDIATSSLPLGMRGRLVEDLRRSRPDDQLPVATPVKLPAR